MEEKKLKWDGNVLTFLESTFLFLFVLACLLFPASDRFLSKKIFFFICFFIFILKLLFYPNKKIINKKILWRISFLIFIPVIFSMFTFFRYKENVIFIIFSSITLLIALCYEGKERFFFRSFIWASNALVIITLIIVFIPNISSVIALKLINLYNSLDSGFIGERNFGSLCLTMVHFRTAPVLIIPFTYHYMQTVDTRKLSSLVWLSLYSIAIVFTASRGIILFASLSVFAVSLVNIKKRGYRILFFLMVVLGGLGTFYLIQNTTVFSLKEQSNSIKIGHVKSFMDYVDLNPNVLIFGKGTGSEYFTKGFNKVVFQTELTYLDMIRYWGILTTIFFLCVFLVPMNNKNISLLIPFIWYFIDASTNPLIFCSTGMLIIALYFSVQKNGD